jgi:hypothetical protein
VRRRRLPRHPRRRRPPAPALRAARGGWAGATVQSEQGRQAAWGTCGAGARVTAPQDQSARPGLLPEQPAFSGPAASAPAAVAGPPRGAATSQRRARRRPQGGTAGSHGRPRRRSARSPPRAATRRPSTAARGRSVARCTPRASPARPAPAPAPNLPSRSQAPRLPRARAPTRQRACAPRAAAQAPGLQTAPVSSRGWPITSAARPRSVCGARRGQRAAGGGRRAAHSEPSVRTARPHAPRTRARAASASPERRAASRSPARCSASASSAARRARPVCARPPQMSSRPNHRPTCGGAQGPASALRLPEDAGGVRRRGRTCPGVQRKRGCSRSAAPRARVSAAASANCREKRPPVGTSRRGVQAIRF